MLMPHRRPVAIAIFVPSLAGGGAERAAITLAETFARMRVDAEMVVATPGGVLRGTLPPGIAVVDLGARSTIRALPALARYMRHRRPAAMIGMLTHGNTVMLAARELARVPMTTVCVEHINLDRDRPDSLRDRGLRLGSAVAYRRASTVAGVSHIVSRSAERLARLPQNSVPTLFNPIDAGRLRRLALCEPVPEWLRCTDRGPTVVAVGRLVPQKDHLTLIRAFRLVADVFPRASLLILGEGPLRTELRREAQRMDVADKLVLPGFVENPYQAIARASVLALSSVWEGMPTVVLEALALKTAVVATTPGSGVQEVLAGGPDVEFVPVGGHEAMGAALVRTIKNAPNATRDMPRFFDPFDAASRYLAASQVERV
jgi:glycosyltransferase involved in cell wall biosynthesis